MVTTSSSIQTGFPRRIGPAEEMFGYERTIETVREGCAEEITAEDLVERLMSRARQFAGDEPQADDMTCVVVWVNGWASERKKFWTRIAISPRFSAFSGRSRGVLGALVVLRFIIEAIGKGIEEAQTQK